ncbi:acyl-CoA dehydrogenase family protein [Aeromicrobium sp. YIM 150415]|uniref:acyl-CoA dehydrogenase family protein n=1 Tax=Aeromicrobium sp. YIM 150415 TaxID=2803912 RepID=UPI001963C26D|nr:acyl-CoA dehydrogenase family protein [Aeromicrobium sp. YIM 150415]MBM9464030.1 acyl-CoA dehydrogenase family protein [Aeromicrobium sp. YIM 150415]
MYLAEDEQEIVKMAAVFADRQIRPRVREFEQDDVYPEPLIESMKELGFFGMLVPEEFGGSGLSAPAFASVTIELARGWMSLAGATGGHSVVSYLLDRFGTPEQKKKYLPRMADGSLRATMALTEPGGGSDLQAMATVAKPNANGFVVRGSKTWISNAQKAGLFALLCKTDPEATPRHSGISVLLIEPGEGMTVSGKIPKLGYRGVEACELTFDGMEVPADAALGGDPGRGWVHMMSGLEVGRIQVAARAVGVAQAALDDASVYAQQRESFGKPIWRHQAVGNLIADMATKVHAARLLTLDAANQFQQGVRSDLEAGMAKLYASEIAAQVALDAVRVHGGYGYSKEYDVERYYRDAPLMIVGEGTNEIQRNVIAAQYIGRHKVGHQ